MVPGHFVQLDYLPLTINGKIDKQQLPDPKLSNAEGEVEYVAPGNDIEERLAAIWEDVFEKEKIGIKDDFITLGGNSLKAMRILAQIQKEFNVRIKLEDLFVRGTIAAIGNDIERECWLRQNKDEYEKNFIV
jgi:acyl carrier protein